ncbi:hypothetical protein IQ273_08200 [Nodosilinea sp. LEGE 07298]|uniref:hypothetical protein n=1 Tax=Nodosilinea sp. LEGE 07298 TaxID=2777970 RepID=UPI00187E342D|nr:hypothetical protein [Nodosilinea sp. LEGE 07298]MBE9109396.1 hypothetical protein [Nodosilinea sp. LEGE 07298]
MIIFKSIVVWLVFILAESVNGTVRTLWLIPALGPSLAHTVSFIIGSLLIVTLATLFVPWLKLSRWQGLGIGLLWSSLTLAFEVGLGRLGLGYSWSQIGADYDIAHGGLMPFGLVLMALSPLIGRQIWRGLGDRQQNN